MKRALMLVLMIILCLGTGCVSRGGGDRERILDIRAKYIAVTALDTTVDMIADYGDRVYNYKLSYSGNGTKGEISVLEPQNIKGLMAAIDGSDVILKYDGAILETGVFSEDGISPIEAFPLMVNAWCSGYISSHYREKMGDTDCLVAEIDMTDAGQTETMLNRVWFSADTSLPVKAEITVNGFTVINCSFKNTVLR